MSPKGLIIVPDFTADIGNNSLSIRNIGGKHIVDAVRRNLPYWDKFDFPNNMLIGVALPNELSDLHAEGVVQQSNPRFPFSGGAAELWVLSQIAAWREHEDKEPGVWTLGQFGDRFWIPESERVVGRTIEVELHSVLPTPGPDTSLEAILEFKRRRNSELAAFRSAMDQLYLEIVSSGDIPRARNAAIDTLERALRDLDQTAKEGFVGRFLSTFKVELSVNAITGAAGGALLASQTGIPISLGAGVGAVSSIVKFELTPRGVKPRSEGRRDFAYLYNVQEEL